MTRRWVNGMVTGVAMAIATSMVLPEVAGAQVPDSGVVRPRGRILGRGRLGAPRLGDRAGRGGRGPRQEMLAEQVRQAFQRVVKRQLALDDKQSARLKELDDRYQVQRTEVGNDERDARMALKTALEDTTNAPNQAQIDDNLTRLVRAQRRRADILEAEQKDLATFLTPVQRAKYFALRDQLTRRISEMRDGRGGGPGGPGGPDGPPRGPRPPEQ